MLILSPHLPIKGMGTAVVGDVDLLNDDNTTMMGFTQTESNRKIKYDLYKDPYKTKPR